MVLYRRNRIPGGTYFFTVTLRDRSSFILVDHIGELRTALLSVKRERPFEIIAMVVLPEHLHALWELPPGDDDYPGRIQLMKARFSRAVAKSGFPLNRDSKGGYVLWQSRYWEHTIRDERDLEKHIDYIHWNPVKHGYVTCAADWPHSTFHRYVAQGVYRADWAGIDVEDDDYGE